MGVGGGTKPLVFSHLWLVLPGLRSASEGRTLAGTAPCGWWRIYLLTQGTLAVKLPRVLADTSFSGKSFQSLMVFGRNEDYLYWMRHWTMRITCTGCDIGSRKAAVSGLSFGGLLLYLVLICPPSHHHAAFCRALTIRLVSNGVAERASQGSQALQWCWMYCNTIICGNYGGQI